MQEFLTTMDKFWLQIGSPSNLMIINGLVELDENVDFYELLGIIEKSLLTFDEFQNRIVKINKNEKKLKWERDPYFDIRSHVHKLSLPLPSDKSELVELIEDLGVSLMDETKPLWQIYLIQGYNNGCVIFFRLHQCLLDRINHIKVLNSISKILSDSFKDKIGDKKISTSFTYLSTFNNLMKKYLNIDNAVKQLINSFKTIVYKPANVVNATKKTAYSATDKTLAFTKLFLTSKDSKTVLKGAPGARKHFIWSKPFPLRDVKKASRITQTDYIDVLISSITAALRNYLEDKNSINDKTEIKTLIIKRRRTSGPIIDEENGLNFSFISFPLNIDDHIPRLKEINSRIKKSDNLFLGLIALKPFNLFPFGISKRISNFLSNRVSAIIADISCPRTIFQLGRKKIKNIAIWSPSIGKINLGINFVLFGGGICLSILSDKKILPDAEKILNYFEDDLVNTLNSINNLPSYKSTINNEDIQQETAEINVVNVEDNISNIEEQDHCKAVTKKGSRCKNKALPGLNYCNIHQKAMNE
ncbi:MAG: DUF1298 domain-containing protein [Desulfobacterales bacterium]|nr:DUF1298 domain-containing protein [Desulfobacterales bacterium]